jgi:hypothetical protein
MTRPALAAARFPATFTAMFSGLPPVPNFLLRLALTFGAGLMIAALL